MGEIGRFVERYKTLVLCLFLFIMVFAAYARVGGNEFLLFDDDVYIYDNPYVSTGLSSDNIIWAFGSSGPDRKTYWHPLTWISHMADSQLFGLNPGMHHLMNVFFHTVNVLLVFLLLNRSTGAFWKSALAALLFALHPINVDTVAWAAERKNVLSTTFWLLAMHIYFMYARHPKIGTYLGMTGLFILGLLSKPMLVTFPFVLLLMDYWPLNRISFPMNDGQLKYFEESFPRARSLSPYAAVALEKLPLLIIALAAMAISSASLRSGGSLVSTEMVPMGLRVSNAIVSYVLYLWKFVWPAQLTFFYPYPQALGMWQVMGSLLLIAFVSAAAFWYSRSHPFFVTGWLWFLGTLVPVSGIVQGGLWPQYAERWAYVPFIGLMFALAWLLDAFLSRRHHLKVPGILLMAVVLALFSARIAHQLPRWQNSVAFFSNAVEVDPENDVAYMHLGHAYYVSGQKGKAVSCYDHALRLKPLDPYKNLIMGNVLAGEGRFRESEAHYRVAMKAGPWSEEGHAGLANSLKEQKRYDEALREYKEANKIVRGSVKYYEDIAEVLMMMGDAGQAADYYSKILKFDPCNYELHAKLGDAYAAANRFDESVRAYRESLRYNPGFQDAQAALEAVQAKSIKLGAAIRSLESCLGSSPKDLETMYKLALLHASRNDYDKAMYYLDKISSANPGDPDVHYNVACVKSRQNKRGEAVDALRKAVGKGFSKWDILRSDRDLANIRDTDYFRSLLSAHP